MPPKKRVKPAITTDVVFYHHDADGHCAGALWKYHNESLGDKAKSLVMHEISYGYNYDETLAPFVGAEGHRFVFLDFCPTKEDFAKIKGHNPMIVIDHHATSEWAKAEEVSLKEANSVQVYHKIGVGGCELTWQTLFDDTLRVPPAVWMVGRYDVWDHSVDKRIVPFVTGLTLLITDPAEEDGYSFWKACFETFDTLPATATPEERAKRMKWDVVMQVLNMGITAHMYREASAERLSKHLHEMTLCGKKLIMLNADLKDTYDFPYVEDLESRYYGLGWYYWTGKKWNVSLRTTTEDNDVSAIAKTFGGGGHKGAAGFSNDNFNFPQEMTDAPSTV